MVSTRAALLYGPGQDYKIETIDIDGPAAGEVLIQMKAGGLCHSDEHARTGDMPMPHYPIICGHEGAGEVLEVGPGVTSVAPGDHVAMSFVPSCGQCKSCRKNKAYLCDLGATLFNIGMPDGRIAHKKGDETVARYAQLGAFSEIQLLSEASVVKVDADIPWQAVALTSCGVATGFGSAVNRANVRPGDTVAVLGVGGIGINADPGRPGRRRAADHRRRHGPVQARAGQALRCHAHVRVARRGPRRRRRADLGRDVRLGHLHLRRHARRAARAGAEPHRQGRQLRRHVGGADDAGPGRPEPLHARDDEQADQRQPLRLGQPAGRRSRSCSTCTATASSRSTS